MNKTLEINVTMPKVDTEINIDSKKVDYTVKLAGSKGDKGPKGDKGDAGKSAYELACEHGYVGTEEEWLDSLKLSCKTYITNQLASYAPKNSPALTGTPTSTTPMANDNSTKIATTEFVNAKAQEAKDIAQDAKNVADNAKDVAAGAKATAEGSAAKAQEAKDIAQDAADSATNAANSAKAAADSATAAANSAREQQADWNVTDTTSKAFVKNKPDVLLKSGGTATGDIIAPSFQTGTDASHYFQCRRFRGEGTANTYYHAVDFGYAGHNQVDFYEYGGLWNFHKTTDGNTSKLVGSIKAGQGWNGLVKGQDITTYAKKSDLASSLSTKSLTVTGETSVPTANAGNSSKAIANTEFVAKSIAALVNGALTVKIFSATATNAAPCATLKATAQSGYKFLCWVMVWTDGTVVHVHTNHPETSNAQIWATDSSAVAGKTISGMALYVKEA